MKPQWQYCVEVYADASETKSGAYVMQVTLTDPSVGVYPCSGLRHHYVYATDLFVFYDREATCEEYEEAQQELDDMYLPWDRGPWLINHYEIPNWGWVRISDEDLTQMEEEGLDLDSVDSVIEFFADSGGLEQELTEEQIQEAFNRRSVC